MTGFALIFPDESVRLPAIPANSHRRCGDERQTEIDMKIQHSAVVLMMGMLSLAGPGIVHAQSYSIDWHTIAGGGGASSNGPFIVSGTLGQHDASGPMTGGHYSLTGGFWALFAVQTPGSPLLAIFLTATNTAVIQWPSPSTGFVLQQNPDLATTNWTAPGESIVDNSTNKFIVVNPSTGNRFYRLFHP